MIHFDRDRKHKQIKQYPFERFASVRRYIDFDFKNPSWMLCVSDTNGQFNLWRQSYALALEESQCSSYSLTNFVDNSVRRVFSSPADNSAIFFADHNGDENFQIYKIEDVFNGWPEQITFKPQIRYEWGSECFSHDGKHIRCWQGLLLPSEIEPGNLWTEAEERLKLTPVKRDDE